MRLPEFITFTGLDAATDLSRAKALSHRFPIEWGVLFSGSRQGNEHRYPDAVTVANIANFGGLRLAAHLCGSHSADILASKQPALPVGIDHFHRIQINCSRPAILPILSFQAAVDRGCVLQCRGDTFPADRSVTWLFDRSGGVGKQPDTWPPHPDNETLVGYAGGIGPDNVLSTLKAVSGAGPYWIDMESNVRTDDVLDLDKCEMVCRLVYGGESV